MKGASSSSLNKNVISCAFCSCSEQLPWFRAQFKSYGPLSKLVGSPSSNEIFRPYLETDTVSTRSGGGHSTPEPKDGFAPPSSEANSIPMHVGYFFRSNVHSVVDCEEMIWAHKSCMDWSMYTVRKKELENPLLLVGTALTQVHNILRGGSEYLIHIFIQTQKLYSFRPYLHEIIFNKLVMLNERLILISY